MSKLPIYPVHIILGQIQITQKLIKFYIHPYSNHTSKKKQLFHLVLVVTSIESNVECRVINVRQPNCTYQCRCRGVVDLEPQANLLSTGSLWRFHSEFRT